MTKTNRINSKIDQISKLLFNPLPVKPTTVTKAVRTNDVIVLIDEKGRIYTSQASHRRYWVEIERFDSTVQGLIKMGLLTDNAVAEHKAAQKVEEEARTRHYAARELLEAAETLAITLPAALVTEMEKLAYPKKGEGA